jgi:hypothetical protein
MTSRQSPRARSSGNSRGDRSPSIKVSAGGGNCYVSGPLLLREILGTRLVQVIVRDNNVDQAPTHPSIRACRPSVYRLTAEQRLVAQN